MKPVWKEVKCNASYRTLGDLPALFRGDPRAAYATQRETQFGEDVRRGHGAGGDEIETLAARRAAKVLRAAPHHLEILQ